MATQSLINPFADHGGIVYGDRFVGREKELATIEQRVLGPSYGNLAIMGLPRVGKSSLAWQGVMSYKDTLIKNNTIPIFFQVGGCDSSRTFFKQLVILLDEELSIVCTDSRYEKFAVPTKEAILSIIDSAEFNIQIQKYFKLVKRLGFKCIYILDEFDSVEDIFDVADFQLLRELSYNPETKICLLTCSRKTIQEIEAKNGAISNFYGTFSEIRLGMFNEEDIAQYWSRVSEYPEVSEKYKSDAVFYVGHHPYLLDVYNDYCFRNSVFDLDDVSSINKLDEIRLQLWHQFKTIQDTLSHEDLLNKAIQLVLGPIYDVNRIQEEKLLKYQFIRIVDNEHKMHVLGRLIGFSTQGRTYVCFSDYFTKVFDQDHTESIDYWPLWTDTEKMIRRLIKTFICENYTADWETEIQAKYGISQDWQNKFDGLLKTRRSSRSLFPNASNNLIDYTMSRDMYDVFMSKEWGWFGKVFPGQKKDWAKIFTYLADIRNPIAHNNKEFISQEQIVQATEYCDRIIRSIGEWEAKDESNG